MKNLKKIIAIALAGVMTIGAIVGCGSSGNSGSGYPTKGVTVICPWSAGGGTDSCLRAFSDALGM